VDPCIENDTKGWEWEYVVVQNIELCSYGQFTHMKKPFREGGGVTDEITETVEKEEWEPEGVQKKL